VADLLIVEDSADVADVLADLLRARGHAVRIAAQGIEGLKLLDERFPQLVLSDVDMPVLSGPGMIYRMFVANLGRENIPIVLMSGSDRLAEIAEAVGTPYFISKPFEIAELFGIIDRALSEAIPPRSRPSRLHF
jgi:DNA-binding NtrC family response regulator